SGGTYNYVADMLVRNPIALMDLVNQVANDFGDFIHHQEIVTRIHGTHFPKQYLLDACLIPQPATYFGGPIDEQIKSDEVDEKILRILATNARARLIDIAEEVELSDRAVGQRVKRLEEVGLITGYFAWIEPQAFGYQSYNLLLKHQKFRKEDDEQ